MKNLSLLLALMLTSMFVRVVFANGSGQTVVVIDTGFDKTYPINYRSKSACFSESERSVNRISFERKFLTPVFRSDITTTSILYDGNIMSKCPNGQQSQSGSSSSYGANMPVRKKYRKAEARNYELNGSSARYVNSSFEDFYSDVIVKHGTNVARQVAIYAPSAHIFPITIGNINRQVNCKVLDTISEEYNQSSPDYYVNRYDKLIRQTGCGDFTTQQILLALDHVLKNPSGVAAINFSGGAPNSSLCSTRQGQNLVNALNNKGIAVIASVGNIVTNSSDWPACLPNVIGVARITSGGAAIGSSIRDNKQDFFMTGEMSDYKTGSSIYGTSFSSPKVAGIYASLKSINPNASVADITNVLKQTGSRIGSFAGRRINYQRAVEEIKKVTGNPPPTDPPSDPPPTDDPDSSPAPQPPTLPGKTAVLGFTDDTLYRDNFSIFFNLNGATSIASNISPLASSNANIGVTNVRDIKLSFKGKYYYRTDPNNLNGVDIFVNGVKRINFNTVQYFNTPAQLYFKKHTFMLNRNWLKNGDNEIRIRNAGPFSNLGMETTDIRMDYNLPIKMKLGQKITKLYGHRVGSKKHLTGLRVEFASPKSNVEFSATGFDIDSAIEIAVFLNQKRIGYLNRGSSGRYNASNTFKLRKEDYVSSGVNTIEFVQTSSSDQEMWGVTNMELVGIKSPSLAGVLMLLLDD